MNPAQAILIMGMRLYRWVLSPLKQAVLGPAARCRFTPSCSAYAVQAITVHGAWRGAWLTVRRLSRCHPWGGTGYDPVPEPRSKMKSPAGRGTTGQHPLALEATPRCCGVPFGLTCVDRRPAKSQTSHAPAS